MRWLTMVRGAGSELGFETRRLVEAVNDRLFSLARSPGPVVSAPLSLAASDRLLVLFGCYKSRSTPAVTAGRQARWSATSHLPAL
jgi:hypothetical protein